MSAESRKADLRDALLVDNCYASCSKCLHCRASALGYKRANSEIPTGIWIQTGEGKQLRIPEFNADAISLGETATVLSRICRFGGRTRVFYSVAEHSVRVAQCVADLGGTLHEQFYALNHEGDEALLGFDTPSPITTFFDPPHGPRWRFICEWERLAAKLGVSDVQKPVP